MKRTMQNCGIIKRCIKWGIGEPKTLKDGKCDGYENKDGEPIRECQKCKLFYWYEDDE